MVFNFRFKQQIKPSTNSACLSMVGTSHGVTKGKAIDKSIDPTEQCDVPL